jgi:predicted Zn-dependent protease
MPAPPIEPGFPGLDTAAVARAVALVAGDAAGEVEVAFERRLELELPFEGAAVGVRLRREEGVVARLADGDRSWIASRDSLSGHELGEALRQVVRVGPPAAPEPRLELAAPPAEPPRAAVEAFPGRLERALRRRFAAFPLRLAVRWQRRDLQVVGARMVPPAEREEFFSLEVELPWGRCGALSTGLGEAEAEALAARLVARFRARDAPPPPSGRCGVVFAPAAAAVVLHEAVAHALEADLLSRGGRPDAAIGVELGAPTLDVLDDPAGAPPGVDRATDDEGMPVQRRWLLRGGRVDQPIADRASARRWPALLPGSGFRSGRHGRILPRTVHLELLPGVATEDELFALADGGWWVPEIGSGALDPDSGRFTLEAPFARRVTGGAPAETCGRLRLAGRVPELLAGVVGIGAVAAAGGAGWCAKGGERRAVWARVPAIAVAALEVEPA